MTATGSPAPFDIARVISRLFAVLSRNIAVFSLLALVLAGGPALLTGLAQLAVVQPAAPTLDPTWFLRVMGSGFASFLTAAMANAVLQGAVIHGAVSDLAGGRATFSDCLNTGFRHFLPLIGFGVLSAIGIGLGLIALIVPGVVLALMWSVGAPAIVMENRGVFGAFDRSGALTVGHRGSILVLAILLWLAQIAVSIVLAAVMGIGATASLGGFGGLAGVTSGGFSAVAIGGVLSSAVERTVTAAFTAAGVASVYYELRQIKEGIGAEQLAAVFD